MHTALNLHTLLLVFALVFAVLATVNVPSPPRFIWLPAWALFMTLAFVFV